MLQRAEVINRFLELFTRPSYLEIGVNRGKTFKKIRAFRKVAVDPTFLFDTKAFSGDASTEFYEIPSDHFFAEVANQSQPFDVIYLDGLHTFEQTLRDLLNALFFLTHTGVIIIDDVLPNSFEASLPDFEQVRMLRKVSASAGVNWESDGSWMGDVFKVPFFIEGFLQQCSYATVAENHGQTVVWRQARPTAAITPVSVETVARLDYRDTILSRSNFHILPIREILSKVDSARRLRQEKVL